MFRIVALLAVTLGTGCAARSADMFRDDTQKLVDARQPDMKACYDAALKTDPKAAGTVKVNFVWEKSTGKLLNPTVDPAGTTAPASVHTCVTKAMEGLVLNPADNREGQGSWTFTFSPQS
jgi:hypothetical protein